METREVRTTLDSTSVAPWSEGRSKAIICKSGPAAVIDSCMLRLSDETEVEHVPTLAEGMQRCLDGGVDILFVNCFAVTARELTALLQFRNMAPDQRIVAVAGEEMTPALIAANLVDEIVEVSTDNSKSQPRA